MNKYNFDLFHIYIKILLNIKLKSIIYIKYITDLSINNKNRR